jgi:eukaryotic-like serine/threonine-protein kinase
MAALDPAAPAVTRRFGRFELRTLLGRSARSMAWRVHDPRRGQELLLVMPRQQPADAVLLERALAEAQRAARLTHPNLLHAVEVGQEERWPFIAYDVPAGGTLVERRKAAEGEAPDAVARWVSQLAAGLAFAHDAGLAHHDLQPWLVSLSDSGAVRLIGLGVAAAPEAPWFAPAEADQRRRSQARDAAERDVLALALLLHGLLAGMPALGEPDLGAALQRLAPAGREPIRLPWDVPRPVPDALRAIANRATDRQVRQLGVLPSMPGAAARAARLALMERQHTEELAQLVLHDAALTLDLLRAVNSAQVRGTQVSGNGPVLTVRRAITMVGLDGVRRSALAMRQWPGPLDAAAAQDLQHAVAAAQHAARLAQALRPPGYDLEMVALVTLLQNLGRLVLHYHCADDMRQVRRLMAPQAAAAPGEADEPGMSEQAAAFAVLGFDIEGMALAVARWMGLGGNDDSVLLLMRRLSLDKAVRIPDNDDELLRALGSAANEAVDALALPVERQAAAIERVAKRYARVLEITPRDLTAALHDSATTPVAAGPAAA